MEPLDRRIALMRAGFRPIDLARKAKVSPSVIYRVLDDHGTSDRVQRLIAKAIDKPVEEVFPQRYPQKSRAEIALEKLAS